MHIASADRYSALRYSHYFHVCSSWRLEYAQVWELMSERGCVEECLCKRYPDEIASCTAVLDCDVKSRSQCVVEMSNTSLHYCRREPVSKYMWNKWQSRILKREVGTCGLRSKFMLTRKFRKHSNHTVRSRGRKATCGTPKQVSVINGTSIFHMGLIRRVRLSSKK